MNNKKHLKFLFVPEDFENVSMDDAFNFDPMAKSRNGHKSNKQKISINKSELSKAVNVGSQSGEAGYAFVPRSYDGENRKFEDKVVNDLDEWIRDRQNDLESELKQFYENL